jgi:hypothetical protein
MKKILLVSMIVMFLVVPCVSAMRVDEGAGGIALVPTTTICFDSEYFVATSGSVMSLNVNLLNVEKCTGWQIYLFYDKTVLACQSVTQGPFLKQFGRTFFGYKIIKDYNATHGRVLAYAVTLGLTAIASGSGVICSLNFQTLASGTSLLHFYNTQLCDEKIPPKPIYHVAIDSIVTVT